MTTYLIEREFGGLRATADQIEAGGQLAVLQDGAQTTPKPVADDRIADGSVDRERHMRDVRGRFDEM